MEQRLVGESGRIAKSQLIWAARVVAAILLLVSVWYGVAWWLNLIGVLIVLESFIPRDWYEDTTRKKPASDPPSRKAREGNDRWAQEQMRSHAMGLPLGSTLNSKRCGKCGRSLPHYFGTGDDCVYCGARFTSDETEAARPSGPTEPIFLGGPLPRLVGLNAAILGHLLLGWFFGILGFIVGFVCCILIEDPLGRASDSAEARGQESK